MLVENIAADPYEYYSAQYFRSGTEPGCSADQTAESESDDGKQRGDNADHQSGKPDRGVQDGEADPHCQSVDAGCHREKNEGFAPGGIFNGFFFVPFAERFDNHPTAYKSEQDKGEPGGHGFSEMADSEARAPAKQGHAGLKEAEMPGEPEELAKIYRAEADPCRHRHSKGVYGQGEGDEKNGEKVHGGIREWGLAIWPR